MGPALALEHFEHRDFIGAQRVTLDRLQMLHLQPAFAGCIIRRVGWFAHIEFYHELGTIA
jgi:hypothetical protein